MSDTIIYVVVCTVVILFAAAMLYLCLYYAVKR